VATLPATRREGLFYLCSSAAASHRTQNGSVCDMYRAAVAPRRRATLSVLLARWVSTPAGPCQGWREAPRSDHSRAAGWLRYRTASPRRVVCRTCGRGRGRGASAELGPLRSPPTLTARTLLHALSPACPVAHIESAREAMRPPLKPPPHERCVVPTFVGLIGSTAVGAEGRFIVKRCLPVATRVRCLSYQRIYLGTSNYHAFCFRGDHAPPREPVA
jgi:hypothetical protein